MWFHHFVPRYTTLIYGVFSKKVLLPLKTTMQNDNDNSLQTKQLTKLEQQHLDAAREKHKKNIVKKQIVMRKEFVATAFIPEPKEIVFRDFELNKIYTQKITLTNVSFSFNSFKVLPLKPEIADFFEVSYKLPGKMSAGTTCDLYIKFLPRVLRDIDDYLPLLAETGPISVPLKCYTKKVLITVAPLLIQFGDVILAEASTVTLSIKNAGALETAFLLGGDAFHTLGTLKKQDITLQSLRILHYSCKAGIVGPFSTSEVQITYMPNKVGPLQSELTVTFEDKNIVPVTIPIVGEGKDVPICVQPKQVDFLCTCFHTLYRDVLSISNRGKVAMKVKLKPPPELKGHLEFIPKVGFVQVDTPFSVQVKFRPLKSIVQQAVKYLNSETNTLDVPIQIIVPDQVMPIYFSLRAIVSSSELSMNPSLIDFGKCSTEETVTQQLLIRNNSLLPQQFGFVKLQQEITVCPNDGFATILPQEELQFEVHFSPRAAIEYNFKLTCRTNRSEDYTVSCSAVGIQPPLRFATPRMKFPAVGKGDFTSQQFVIENVTSKVQEFCFVLPAHCNITMHPTSATIPAKQSITVSIVFQAPKSDTLSIPKPTKAQDEPASIAVPSPEPQKPSKSSKNTKPNTSNAKQVVVAKPVEVEYDVINFYNGWQCNKEDEPWYRCRTFLFPCFVKAYELECIFLEVHCAVVQASLVTEVDAAEASEINFGDVPVFQAVQKTITLRNNSSSMSTVHVNPIDANQPFHLLRAPVALLEAGATCDFVVQFYPQQNTPALYNLQIVSSSTNNAQLSLRGNGQNPNVTIEPAVNVLDIGDVQMGDSIEFPVTISNNCDMIVPFEITFIEERTHPFNYDGTNAFYATPSSSSVPVNGKAQVTLCFAPDHEFIHYRTICKIKYGGKIHEKYVALRGRAWQPGFFVVFGEHLHEQDKKADAFQSDARLTMEDPFVALSKEKLAVKRYQYTFEKVKIGEKRQFMFEIGVTKNAKAGKVDFAFDNLTEQDVKNGFAIDPAKGTLPVGTKKEIIVTFAPTQETVNQIPVPNVDVWVECTLRCAVKDAASSNEFVVSFRGQVLQQ